jgi:hypothetical protein
VYKIFSRKTPFIEESNSVNRRTEFTFSVVFLTIGIVYGAWLLAFWPGFLGEDSLAVLLEIENDGTFHSGKPVFWYYFVKILAGPNELVEIPIAVQIIILAVIFSRILTWCLMQKMTKIFIFGLIFICLAPNMIYYGALLYSDGIYSACVTGLMFEFWLIARRRRIEITSLIILAIALPFAGFARANGIIFIVGVIPLLFLLGKAERCKLLLVSLAWCSVMVAANKAHKPIGIGVLFPMAIFETVNFLRPHPMGLWRELPRVSKETVAILTKDQPVEKIVEFYDPDYWDTLSLKAGGPAFLSLNKKERSKIVSEFYRYNIWQNIPAFLGSRVNVFMVSALSAGSIASLDYSPVIIGRSKSKSEYRKFGMVATESFLTTVFALTNAFRWILASPLLGAFLTIWLAARSLRTIDLPSLIVAVPLVIHLAGIFFFSIAGEYRYLLPYFVAPLVLLPMMEMQRRDTNAEHVLRDMR